MTDNKPGWAVELVGERIDLDDWREQLRQPFDPWVEDHPTDDGIKLLLRTASWVTFTEAADVVLDANRMVERLNGEALLVHEDAVPLRVGQVIRFDQHGKQEKIIFAAAANLRVGGARLRGRISVGNSEVAGPPQESTLQKWFRTADDDDVRADLFAHLNRADNWYDLYKVMELTRRLASASIESALGPDLKEWKRIWQTANCNRHARDEGKYPLPQSPPGLHEAKKFVVKVIPRFL